VEGGQEKRIDPPVHLTFDTVIGVIQAAREGHGIGWSQRATMEDHLKTGELETVLDPFVKELPPFYLYYPEQNKRLECLRLFIDCLKSSPAAAEPHLNTAPARRARPAAPCVRSSD
jgi:DNA-binding transcriptional LysR family regulator